MKLFTFNTEKYTKYATKFIVMSLVIINAGCASTASDESTVAIEKPKAKVIGLRNNTVHVLDLEKSMILYQDILGFELVGTKYLEGKLAGMKILKMQAGDFMMKLAITPEHFKDSLGPVGNTNHNHFMLRVNNIGPIGDKLKAAGYELENNNYVKDKYTFFTGPNGEIIGLSSWTGD